MWPWGHAAVGYLLYTATTRFRSGQPPEPHPIVWLLFGTQLPDLVDKPLVWYVDVLPYGRSLAHSLLFLIPLSLALYLFYERRDRVESVLGFAIGALSHAIVDVLPAILSREFEFAYGLLWPLLPLAVQPGPGSFSDHVLGLEPTPYMLFQLVLTILADVFWYRDGTPGLSEVRDASQDLFSILSQARQ